MCDAKMSSLVEQLNAIYNLLKIGQDSVFEIFVGIEI
jgi:hypothetical protein